MKSLEQLKAEHIYVNETRVYADLLLAGERYLARAQRLVDDLAKAVDDVARVKRLIEEQEFVMEAARLAAQGGLGESEETR